MRTIWWTGSRVPFTHAWPWQIVASMEIRSNATFVAATTSLLQCGSRSVTRTALGSSILRNSPLMRSLSQCRGPQRTALVLLVLLAFVTLQTAAAIVEHPHNHGKDHTHCCAACHAGHLGVLKTASNPRLTPPAMAEARLLPRECRTPADYLGVPSLSRGPPA